MEECLGCTLANKEAPVHVIYENDHLCCFLDHDPFNEGHVLILPKGHYRELIEMEESLVNQIMGAAKVISQAVQRLYDPDGITISQNGGVFSELDHFHLHVVPRFVQQDFQDFYSEVPLENEHLKEKLAETREKLAVAIEEEELK
ncbi:HIT family protein [Thalassobacillus hwangdonensis]|uniref:HIT family protein n=1 Tax=Thalassobacillus hwangdonensis TaxID=546108 RepID=A0ABW3KZ24_9BACI